MDSDQAIWIAECLEEFEHCPKIDWRALMKYATDWEKDNAVVESRQVKSCQVNSCPNCHSEVDKCDNCAEYFNEGDKINCPDNAEGHYCSKECEKEATRPKVK